MRLRVSTYPSPRHSANVHSYSRSCLRTVDLGAQCLPYETSLPTLHIQTRGSSLPAMADHQQDPLCSCCDCRTQLQLQLVGAARTRYPAVNEQTMQTSYMEQIHASSYESSKHQDNSTIVSSSHNPTGTLSLTRRAPTAMLFPFQYSQTCASRAQAKSPKCVFCWPMAKPHHSSHEISWSTVIPGGIRSSAQQVTATGGLIRKRIMQGRPGSFCLEYRYIKEKDRM